MDCAFLYNIKAKRYPKSLGHKKSVDVIFLMPLSVEVLGYPIIQRIRCTYAMRRHLQSYSNRIILKVPKFQQTI